MATVTKKFRDNFEKWAAHRIASGEWMEADMASFKEMLRKDLEPGPDQIREGLTAIIAAGVQAPSMIDDHEERYRLWADYFAEEAEVIRQGWGRQFPDKCD